MKPNISRRKLHARTRRPHPSRKSLAGAIAWLDGAPRWYEGYIVWEDTHGLMMPDARDLALAERALKLSKKLPHIRHHSPLQRLQQRLDLARKTSTLRGADLLALVQPAHLRHPQAVRRLTTLLIAEAICLNPLPANPSTALVSCGERAIVPLAALVANGDAAAPGRALAALLLGVLDGSLPVSFAKDPVAPWLQRAHAWGKGAGLPPDPALIVALLADPDGLHLARRCIATLRSPSPFRLEPDLLRCLLDRGASPATVVAAAETAADTTALVAQLIGRRHELSPDAPRPQRALAERLFQQRQSIVNELVATLRDLLRASADPALGALFLCLVTRTAQNGPATPALSETVCAPIQKLLNQAPKAIRRYFAQHLA